MGRSASTISLELQRNNEDAGYQPVAAERKRLTRRWRGNRLGCLSALRQTIVDQLAMGRSPEIIAGRLRRQQHTPRVSLRLYHYYQHPHNQAALFLAVFQTAASG